MNKGDQVTKQVKGDFKQSIEGEYDLCIICINSELDEVLVKMTTISINQLFLFYEI